MTISLAPTYPKSNPRFLRIQDIMVIHILQMNQWERPVYFSVTVPQENLVGLDKYLRLDGLAYRILPYPVKSIDPIILRSNLIEGKYQYRGLNDPNVYLNNSIIKLLTNVRHGYLKLAEYYLQQRNHEATYSVLEKMSQNLPESHIPFPTEEMALTVGNFYHQIGDTSRYKDLIQHVMQGVQIGSDQKMRLAQYYARLFHDWARAESLYHELLRRKPKNIESRVGLYYVYKRSQQYDKGIELLERMLEEFPGDTLMERELLTIKREKAKFLKRGNP
jgi:tetratricopeptide (TPR) repeat protein